MTMVFLPPGEPEIIAARLQREFERRFGRVAEAVGRAPGRVNLMGEHTDYNGGTVLPVALAHATYVAATAREDGGIRVASTAQEQMWHGRIDDLTPGAVVGWPAYVAGTLWALRAAGHTLPGLDLLIDSTVPLGAGLSSSAALECAAAVAVTALSGRELDGALRHQIVGACVRAEVEFVGAPTGGMDQAVVMHAEPDAALLIDFGDAPPRREVIRLELAGHALLVTDTRVSHALVDGEYGQRRAESHEAANLLGCRMLATADPAAVAAIEPELLRRRAHHVTSEVRRVPETARALTAGDLPGLASAFAASHASLRDDYEVSCPELDEAVAAAVGAGAIAARMTGGGFGGSTVAILEADAAEVIATRIDEAFARRGFGRPRHLIATPSAGASVLVE